MCKKLLKIEANNSSYQKLKQLTSELLKVFVLYICVHFKMMSE